MRFFLGFSLTLLLSCQMSKLELGGQNMALTSVRVNAVISDSVPFVGVHKGPLKASDLVFFSGYIDRLVNSYNQKLERLNTEFNFLAVNNIKDNPVYRQFPTEKSSSSMILLPYYQPVPYHSKAARILLLEDLKVESLILFDFSFYGNGDNLALRVDIFLITKHDVYDHFFVFETPLYQDVIFPQLFSFDGALQSSILNLLKQFESCFLNELTSIKNK